MFDNLLKQAERSGERAASAAKKRIVRALDDAGLEARATEKGVEIRGRGLLRRLFNEAALRWIGRLFR